MGEKKLQGIHTADAYLPGESAINFSIYRVVSFSKHFLFGPTVVNSPLTDFLLLIRPLPTEPVADRAMAVTSIPLSPSSFWQVSRDFRDQEVFTVRWIFQSGFSTGRMGSKIQQSDKEKGKWREKPRMAKRWGYMLVIPRLVWKRDRSAREGAFFSLATVLRLYYCGK